MEGLGDGKVYVNRRRIEEEEPREWIWERAGDGVIGFAFWRRLLDVGHFHVGKSSFLAYHPGDWGGGWWRRRVRRVGTVRTVRTGDGGGGTGGGGRGEGVAGWGYLEEEEGGHGHEWPGWAGC